jgi:hypothetical protein
MAQDHDIIFPRKYRDYHESDMIKDFRSWRWIVAGGLGALILVIGLIVWLYFVISSHFVAQEEMTATTKEVWIQSKMLIQKTGIFVTAMLAALMGGAAYWWLAYCHSRALKAWYEAKSHAPQPPPSQTEDIQLDKEILRDSIVEGVVEGVNMALRVLEESKQDPENTPVLPQKKPPSELPGNPELPALPEPVVSSKPPKDISKLKKAYRGI